MFNIFKYIKEVGVCITAALLITLVLIKFFFQISEVEGVSMMPTLNNKDRIVVDKISVNFAEPKRGDVVIIKYPADTRVKYVKRIAAIAGDRVKIEDNKFYLNGRSQEETYIKDKYIKGYFSEVVVPDNTIFVLGDNRNESIDSRFNDVGFVNKKLIVGKAILKIYPLDKFERIR